MLHSDIFSLSLTIIDLDPETDADEGVYRRREPVDLSNAEAFFSVFSHKEPLFDDYFSSLNKFSVVF